MSTKKRFVDIVSPSIKFTDMTDQSSFVTFAEILSFMDKKEYHHNEKTFELSNVNILYDVKKTRKFDI